MMNKGGLVARARPSIGGERRAQHRPVHMTTSASLLACSLTHATSSLHYPSPHAWPFGILARAEGTHLEESVERSIGLSTSESMQMSGEVSERTAASSEASLGRSPSACSGTRHSLRMSMASDSPPCFPVMLWPR